MNAPYMRRGATPERSLIVSRLVVTARAKHIEVDPTFWDYFEEQVVLEPFPLLLSLMEPIR